MQKKRESLALKDEEGEEEEDIDIVKNYIFLTSKKKEHQNYFVSICIYIC